jgi:hypothetical protein
MYQQKGGYVPKTVLLDEIHVTVLAPRGLKEKDYEAMNRTLHGRRFLGALRRSVRYVIRNYPTLRRATVKVSR